MGSTSLPPAASDAQKSTLREMLADGDSHFNKRSSIIAGVCMFKYRFAFKAEMGELSESEFGCSEDEIHGYVKLMTCQWQQKDKTRFQLFKDVEKHDLARWIDDIVALNTRQPSLDASTPLSRTGSHSTNNRSRYTVTEAAVRSLSIGRCKQCTDGRIAKRTTLRDHIHDKHLITKTGQRRLADNISCCGSRYNKTNTKALLDHVMEAHVEPPDVCSPAPGNIIGPRSTSACLPQADTTWPPSYLEGDATAVELYNNNTNLPRRGLVPHNGQRYNEHTSTASNTYAVQEGHSPFSAPPSSQYTMSPTETTLHDRVGQYGVPGTESLRLTINQSAEYANPNLQTYHHVQTNSHQNPQPYTRVGSDGSFNAQQFSFPPGGSSADRHNGMSGNYMNDL